MAKKKPIEEVPFTELSMRKFKTIKEAEGQFKNRVPHRRIVQLFQTANFVTIGKYSVNAISVLDSREKYAATAIQKLLGSDMNERQFESFAKSIVKKWNEYITKFEPKKPTDGGVKPVSAD